MPFLNGFNASVVVQCNERALNAYGIVIDETQRVLSCWIPYEAGRYYKVIWGCQKRFMESRGDVFIDGNAVGSEIIRYEHRGNQPLVAKKDRSTLTSCDTEPFTFPLQLKEEESEDSAMETSTNETDENPHQSEIRLVIHRIVAHGNATLLNNPDLEENIERIATFVFKYRSMEYLRKHGIDRQTTAIIPLKVMDFGVPANQGDIKSQSVDVEMEDVDDDELLDSKIREAQGQLNALYAKKMEKERKLLNPNKPARYRKPKILRTPSARQKLEEEIQKLPKALRVRARQAALEGLVYARMHCPSDLNVNPQAPEIVEKKPKKPRKRTRSSLRIQGQIALGIKEIRLDDGPGSTDLNVGQCVASTST